MRRWLTIATLALAACNPDGAGCFEPAGETVTATVSLPPFTAIEVSSNVEVVLIPGSVQQVVIATGRNLAGGILAEVREGVLYLDNLNRCNWTRAYINPVVTLTVPGLERITLRGSGQVISHDTLQLDRLKIENFDGVGDCRLILEAAELEIVTNGLANFYLQGSVERLSLGFYWCDGIFFGQNLQANVCRLIHSGSNSLHVQVADSLLGRINSLGHVYVYPPRPRVVEVEENSKGRLVFRD